jgi:hypothetical protein
MTRHVLPLPLLAILMALAVLTTRLASGPDPQPVASGEVTPALLSPPSGSESWTDAESQAMQILGEPVSEATVRAWYEAHRHRFHGTFEEVRPFAERLVQIELARGTLERP